MGLTKNVDFSTAKLLKEKGFDEITDNIYMTNHTTPVLSENINRLKHSDGNNPFISAPTIAEVLMWIYEKHRIWINVSLNQFSKPKDLQWMYSIVFIEDCTYSHSPKSYNSPTEAYQEAIKHCLNKLI